MSLSYSTHRDSTNIPWVEKYRPTDLNNMVLDNVTKRIFHNILDTGHFPNILLYGPPGTGKTTAAMNLICKYQQMHEHRRTDMIIHLNASDDRGVDVIRNQINQFVSSNPIFCTGTKFVILDEVDYMTKNAQNALKCLLYTQSNNIRYCLICNYISRIDEQIQSNFMKFRFNQLPPNKICTHLNQISSKEGLQYSAEAIHKVQESYQSDMRSMINFMQMNQCIAHTIQVAGTDTWNEICAMFFEHRKHTDIITTILNTSTTYNMCVNQILIHICSHMINTYPKVVTPEFMNVVEDIINFPVLNITIVVNMMLIHLHG